MIKPHEILPLVSKGFLLYVLSFSAATAKSPTTLSIQADSLRQQAVSPRVLQDVKGGSRLVTSASQIVEYVLADATSLTLGKDTEVLITRYHYDPAVNAGHLELQLNKGRLRVVGGRVNAVNPITIHTRGGNIQLWNATAFVAVDDNGITRTYLLAGNQLLMTSGGATEKLVRPGFQLVSAGVDAPLKKPRRLDVNVRIADANALNPWLLDNTGGVNEHEYNTLIDTIDSEEKSDDSQAAVSENEDSINDTVTESQDFDAFVTMNGGGIELPNRPDPLEDALFSSNGYGSGVGIDGPDIRADQPTQADGDLRSLAQVRDNARIENEEFIEATREQGRTTNRLYNSRIPFTQIVIGDKQPIIIADNADGISGSSVDPPDKNLQYVFSNESDLSLILDRLDALPDRNHILLGEEETFDASAPFLLLGIQLPQIGNIFENVIRSVAEDEFTGIGSIFADATHFKLFQAGFSLGDNPQVVEREKDNFLLVEVQPGQITDGIPTLAPNRTERFSFATGDTDSRLEDTFSKQFSIDRFFLSAGLDNFEQKDQGKKVADGIRAFLREESDLNLELVDTGLLIVNSGSENPNTQDALFHADFGLEGTGSDQQSTISVTIGGADYQVNTCSTCDIQESIEAVIGGGTIGSSRGTIVTVNEDGTETTADEATVAFSSPLRSTAAGGGNPALKTDDNSIRQGYAGYFVLENFDPEPQSANELPLMGGNERPVGNSGAIQQFAYLRLATGTGSSLSGEVKVGQRSALSLNGWAAGLSEFENNSNVGVSQIDSGIEPDNVLIETDPITNRVQSTLALTSIDEKIFSLGGFTGDETKGTSAFVDNDTFAARTSDRSSSEMAMVTANPIKEGLPDEMQAPLREYQHLKWGFFFGDINTSETHLEHLHLGTWVAGELPDSGDLPTMGTAIYTGHVIGNVFNDASLYTATGSYHNSWDFAARRGTVDMNFDGNQYNGVTQLRTDSVVFDGVLNPVDSSINRTGGLRGNFIQGGGDAAAGVAGRFSIQETGGAPYRASGTFAAERP